VKQKFFEKFSIVFRIISDKNMLFCQSEYLIFIFLWSIGLTIGDIFDGKKVKTYQKILLMNFEIIKYLKEMFVKEKEENFSLDVKSLSEIISKIKNINNRNFGIKRIFLNQKSSIKQIFRKILRSLT
jgi:hypothetical protein